MDVIIRDIDVLQVNNYLVLCNLLPCQCYFHFSIKEEGRKFVLFGGECGTVEGAGVDCGQGCRGTREA